MKKIILKEREEMKFIFPLDQELGEEWTCFGTCD